MNPLYTISHPSSQTTFSLDSVAYATFYWRNKENNIHHKSEPKFHSVNGVIFDADAIAAYHESYPNETALERARRLDILDVWTPVLKLTLKNGHPLVYEGERAIKINKAWKAKVFGSKKK